MKSFTVEISIKNGSVYTYDNVVNINYNFNHRTMVNLTILEDGMKTFKTFFKASIESISVKPVNSGDNEEYKNDQELHYRGENHVSKDLFNEGTQAMM